MTTIDLNNLTKSVKTTVKLQQGSVEDLTFLNDIEGQVQFYESGSDIIVKAYGTKELYGGVKIVDTRKTLVTYTYKNGAKVGDMGSLSLTTSLFSSPNLLSEIYAPVKNKNKYTGTFLSEEVNSTSANETFTLGTGDDWINFDFSHKQGKDTINISKGQNLHINVQNGDDLDYKYTRSGNDLTIKGTRYYDNSYNIKAIVSIASKKNRYGMYNVGIKAYDYDEDTHSYNKSADANIKQSSGLLVTDQYLLDEFGLKKGKTYTIYAHSTYSVSEIEHGILYGEINYLGSCINYFTKTAPVTQELISQITLKDYFKNGTPDSVTGNLIDQAALVEVLNESYDKRGAGKAQTIKDTFFDEELYGGTKGDKITSSGGNDRIEGGGGNDTITLGSGNKDIYFSYGDGNDTIVDAHKADSINLNINMGDQFTRYWYTKSGNNLILNCSYVNEKLEEKTVKTTIKDYFKNGNYNNTNIDVDFKYSGNSHIQHNITDGLSSPMEYITFNYHNDNKNKSVTGTALRDYITAGKNTTKITAYDGDNIIKFHENGKKISATAGVGDDHYRVYNSKVSHDITDLGGNDVLELRNMNANDSILIFDVLANGATANKKNDLETLHIISMDNYGTNDPASYIAKKGANGLLNSVNIKNFFTKEGGMGSGCTETMLFDNNSGCYDFNSNSTNWAEIDNIRSDVASWLAENNYQSSVAVLGSKNSEDISALLQMYAGLTT